MDIKKEFIAHLRKDHDYSWASLKRMFPGMSNSFWRDIKGLAEIVWKDENAKRT